MQPEVISIVGPTASGKSRLAIELASAISGEIVSLDAYQIYRGMDIGTAKVTAAEQALIPHHLIDIVEIEFAATISDFTAWAQSAIADINARGKVAICVGGSGLYVQSVLEQLDIPPTDPAVRAKYQTILEEIGEVNLHAQLASIDPVAAAQILPGNTRRVVRALEVNEITGKAFAAELSANEPRYRDLRIGITVDRTVLRNQIELRVRAMLEAGWQSEVAALLPRGLMQTPTACKAIGYREVAALLNKEIDEESAIELITNATARFAKRQMSWFNRDSKIVWNPATKWNYAEIEKLF